MGNLSKFANQSGMAPVFLPLMTVEAYAELAGIPFGVLTAQVDRGMWPTVKIGKRRLLNIAALWQQCAEREY